MVTIIVIACLIIMIISFIGMLLNYPNKKIKVSQLFNYQREKKK